MSLPFDLSTVRTVTFFKRDELTTDLICCEVEVDGADLPEILRNNEESESWQEWIDALQQLKGFEHEWFALVSQPAFAPNVTVAYQRPVA